MVTACSIKLISHRVNAKIAPTSFKEVKETRLSLLCLRDFRSWESLQTLSALYIGPFEYVINTYSMKQSDLYYFETIKMTSQALSHILYGEYEPQAGILCEL